MQELLERAEGKVNEVERLRKDIKAARKRGDNIALLALVKQLLELKPADRKAKELHEQLTKRAAGPISRVMGKNSPSFVSNMSSGLQWMAVAGLFLLLVCYPAYQWSKDYLNGAPMEVADNGGNPIIPPEPTDGDDPFHPPEPVPSQEPTTDAAWTDLFNGIDLSGWTIQGADAKWTVQNGIVRGERGSGWLVSDASYEDFELEFEYELQHDTQSGVLLRAPAGATLEGGKYLEVQILDNQSAKYTNVTADKQHGSLWGIAAAKQTHDVAVREWHRMNISAVDKQIIVFLDGLQVLESNLSSIVGLSARQPGALRQNGRLALQLSKFPVAFRKVRIRQLTLAEGIRNPRQVTDGASGSTNQFLDSLQGNWFVVRESTWEGPNNSEQLKNRDKQLVVNGDQFRVTYLGGPSWENMNEERGRITLDVSKSPVQIDLLYKNKSGQDLSYVGIVELTGNELRHRFRKVPPNTTPPERPKSFDEKIELGNYWENVYARIRISGPRRMQLSDWHVAAAPKNDPVPEGTWSEDPRASLIRARPTGLSELISNKKYRDFRLEFEWRFPKGKKPGPNGSGVVIRSNGWNTFGLDPQGIEIDLRPKSNPDWFNGTGVLLAYDADVNATSDRRKTRNIKTMIAPPVPRLGEWMSIRINCVKDRLEVFADGKLTNVANGLDQRSGNIVLRSQNSAVDFRNLEITELE